MESFHENIELILYKQRITLDEFNAIRIKVASELTYNQRKIMLNIRESVPKVDNETILQKVFDGGKIENYLKEDGPWNTVGGFITRVEDVKNLRTLKEVYDGLRLDYNNNPFNLELDKDYGVIRFKVDNPEKISMPYGPDMKEVGAKLPINGFNPSQDPFTGHGFTKDINGNIIPENTIDYLEPNKGAELYKINSVTGII